MRTPWLGSLPLILASTSPTRRLLLEGAGLAIEIAAPQVDERALEAQSVGLSPPELACRLASAKAGSVSARHPERVVIGADQVLELDGRIFHKPRDAAEACGQLERLSGRTHALHSAVAIVAGASADAFVVTARMTMRALGSSAIASYVACLGEERVGASVGGYQLEGLGIHLFERVEGDHSTILGMPLLPVLARLRAAGLLAF